MPNRWLFIEFLAWHDHFFNTSSGHKQLHKLLIDIKRDP